VPCAGWGEVEHPCELRGVARSGEESECEDAARGRDVGVRCGRAGERQRRFELILRERGRGRGRGRGRDCFCIRCNLMRDERARTKPAELNTAPLPALKIGLSEDTVRHIKDWPWFLSMTLALLAFHNTHGRDGRIHRLTAGA
jgi:hypothetical protein